MTPTCSRCGSEPERVTRVAINLSAWALCGPCLSGLMTWWTVRKGEFPPAQPRDSSELMHACRMALDIADPHPAVRDVLRAAIKGAYERMQK